jgi:small subunit ribosomal protein S18
VPIQQNNTSSFSSARNLTSRSSIEWQVRAFRPKNAPSNNPILGSSSPNDSQIRGFDLKNLQKLRRFLTEQGKIISRRITGLTASEQRQLTSAVKQARILGLLAFTPTTIDQNQ